MKSLVAFVLVILQLTLVISEQHKREAEPGYRRYYPYRHHYPYHHHYPHYYHYPYHHAHVSYGYTIPGGSVKVHQHTKRNADPLPGEVATAHPEPQPEAEVDTEADAADGSVPVQVPAYYPFAAHTIVSRPYGYYPYSYYPYGYYPYHKYPTVYHKIGKYW